MMRFRSLLPLLAAVIATRTTADAQRLAGVVTDSASGEPVAGALVRLGATEEETDATGAFAIDVTDRPGDTLVIHRIGYHDVRLATTASPDGIRVRMRPDPVMLQALRAVGRSRSIVEFAGGKSGEEGWIIGAGPPIRGFSVLQLLEDRVGYRRVLCRGPAESARPAVYCSMIRGRAEPIAVYVDGRLAAGGLDDVTNFPLTSIYSVDVSRDRRVVSLVTNQAAEAAARAYLTNRGAFP